MSNNIDSGVVAKINTTSLDKTNWLPIYDLIVTLQAAGIVLPQEATAVELQSIAKLNGFEKDGFYKTNLNAVLEATKGILNLVGRKVEVPVDNVNFIQGIVVSENEEGSIVVECEDGDRWTGWEYQAKILD